MTPTELQALAEGRFDMYDGYLEIDGDTIEPNAHEAVQALATQLLTAHARIRELEAQCRTLHQRCGEKEASIQTLGARVEELDELLWECRQGENL